HREETPELLGGRCGPRLGAEEQNDREGDQGGDPASHPRPPRERGLITPEAWSSARSAIIERPCAERPSNPVPRAPWVVQEERQVWPERPADRRGRATDRLAR